MNKVLKGSVEPQIKSAPVPEKDEGFVKVAVGSTFKKMILESDKEFLVDFYTPWCEQCREMAPAYEEAARRLAHNPNIELVKIDLNDNEVFGVEIEGFPTIKFYQKDKNRDPIKYTGGLTADEIIDWLRRHVHHPWIDLQDQNEDL